jgi:hypothetical protein
MLIAACAMAAATAHAQWRQDIDFRTGATAATASEVMRIKSGGNVGIGTQSPTATLQVSGSLIVSTSAQTTTPTLWVGAGQVGLGTSSPAAKLGVDGRIRAFGSSGEFVVSRRDNNATAWSIYSNSGELHFHDQLSSSNKITVLQTSGNVGIGTTAPNAKLDVVGTISGTALLISGTAQIDTLYVNGQRVRGLVQMNEVTASGTQVDFTGIPTEVDRVTVMFREVSMNGAGEPRIQLGTSGGIQATGYVSAGLTAGGNNKNATDSCLLASSSAAADTHSGPITFTRMSGNSWVMGGILAMTNSTARYSACYVNLTGTLDRLRVTDDAGGSFDSGSIAVMYE